MTFIWTTAARPRQLAVAWLQLIIIGLCGVATRAIAPTPQPGRTSTIKDTRISRQGDLSIVTIEADGPLPTPTVGQLDSPPRFFMDFPDVSTATRGASGGSGGAVLRVRVALHSTEPRITRVVIDLAQKQPIRTEAEEQEQGRFKILIGATTPQPNPPPVAAEPKPREQPRPTSPSNPPPVSPPPVSSDPRGTPATSGTGTTAVAPATPSPAPAIFPSRPPPPAPPARDVDRYREQVEPIVSRLTKLRPLLNAIDLKDARPPEGLGVAREEFSGILRTLTTVRAPETVRATHDLLVRSASFGLMAATLREDAGMRADPDKLRNAASAAAGALLLLDRVCIEIKCAALPKGSK